MKLLFISIVLVSASLLVVQRASAQDYRLALGIRLSNSTPTLNNSITGKYFITDRTAIEGLVSFGSRFGLGGLIEIHKPLNVAGLRWFYGAGAYVGFENNPSQSYFGPTGILGMDYKFSNVPINLSVDWKPELDIIPDINFVPDAFALSVRFTFSSKGQRQSSTRQ
ncbi:MAG TPA: hypothetical protein VM012_02110 [Flavitalea sp.]|nr:hypothetical protein [Flavitalea sp.]